MAFLKPSSTYCLKLSLLCILVTFIYFQQRHIFYRLRLGQTSDNIQLTATDFYYNITQPRFSCAMRDGVPVSYAGLIGLEGDSEETPKRSFFWYFEAENNPEDAPVIIAGGPGTTGLLNGMNGQSPCIITPTTLEYNPHRWTEDFNLILLDYPTGVGYSFGTRVNNSHDAALDAYDFLQKFFMLFPRLQSNQFVISGGSYGGIYVPNIASTIQLNNQAIHRGTAPRELLSINLEAIMLSNPLSNPFVHFQWLLDYRCQMHQLYNSSMCTEMYSSLPTCLERIELAYQFPDVRHRSSALNACQKYSNIPTEDDIVIEDIRRKCKASPKNSSVCHELFAWMETFFNKNSTKGFLGLSTDHEYVALSFQVNSKFMAYGDLIQPHHELFTPLLEDGIRFLFYIGAQDALCSWPGVLSTVKQLRSPHQAAFLISPDIPWHPGFGERVDIRQVGNNAGDLTFMLLDGAGHFVVADQPRLSKLIAYHWIQNIPFVNISNPS